MRYQVTTRHTTQQQVLLSTPVEKGMSSETLRLALNDELAAKECDDYTDARAAIGSFCDNLPVDWSNSHGVLFVYLTEI